jgi:hypothetical protein
MPQHPCQHRTVLEDGRVTCDKIVLGDPEVSLEICDNCPAQACNCQHLRFSLKKIALTPITVRWANGHREVWDDQPPRVSFLHSACAQKTTSVLSPTDCLACSMRHSIATEPVDQVIAPPAPVALGENVIPFVRPLHREPSLPCISS